MTDPRPHAKTQSRASQRVTLDLPVRSLIRALELVEAGRYSSLEDLVSAAIEALYRARGPARPIGPEHVDEVAFPRLFQVGQSAALEDAEVGAPRIVAALPPTSLPHPLLPLTVPRFLPGKVILRFLARTLAKADSEDVDAADFRKQLRYKAFSWTSALKQLDLAGNLPKGERLSTAFPTADRDQEKSMNRLLEVYLGSPYVGSPKVGGALPFLGFVAMTGPAGSERVGITSAGLEFARMTNPVLDEGEATFPPFRGQEVSHLVSAIRMRSPAEHEHMRFYVQAVDEMGNASRDALTARMRNFYVRFWSPLDLNAGMVESLRATVHSRCQELGFVRTQREGRGATYLVTDAGSSWLRGDSPEKAGESNP